MKATRRCRVLSTYQLARKRVQINLCCRVLMVTPQAWGVDSDLPCSAGRAVDKDQLPICKHR